MKKCPTCQRTFEDSMRFCQSDGTPLVAAEEPIDPYKTIVARPGDVASSSPEPPKEARPEPEAPAAPSKMDEEVLQLPEQKDPLKTAYVSEEEIRREMARGSGQDDQVMEIPPLTEAPAPPKFIEPDLNVPPRADAAPPPSPFSSDQSSSPAVPPQEQASEPNFEMTTPPIPSPFSEPKKPAQEPAPEPPRPAEPEPPPPRFAEPEPTFQAKNDPFAQSPVQDDWATPAVADIDWQPAPAGQNLAAPEAGLNQTLAIVSLVLGIASIVICQLTGPVAVVLGFLARRKVSQSPGEYGGAGLALGGIITGIIGTLFLILAIAYLIFVFGFLATGALR